MGCERDRTARAATICVTSVMTVTSHIVTTEPPDQFWPAPHIVKPRVRIPRIYPVIAVIDDRVLTEDGEAMFLDELIRNMPSLQPTLFAAMQGADLLAYLDNVFAMSHPTAWQWRVSDSERRIYASHPDERFRHSRRVTIAVHF